MLVPHQPHQSIPKQDLGPADPDRMAAAAEELRERTMSFERVSAPTPWLFGLAVVTLVVVLVGLLLAYRRPLQLLMRKVGL